MQDHIAKGGTVVFACWHQRFFSGFFVPRIFGMNPCIMISQSRDGDVVSDVVARIGWVPVRGSTSRGGKKALQEMIAGVEKYRMSGHIVDGPQGPPHIVKPGLIALASQTGAAICPGYISYDNPWVFNSWDRFMIPKPFSRVLLRAGDFIFVPKELDEKSLRGGAPRRRAQDDRRLRRGGRVLETGVARFQSRQSTGQQRQRAAVQGDFWLLAWLLACRLSAVGFV